MAPDHLGMPLVSLWGDGGRRMTAAGPFLTCTQTMPHSKVYFLTCGWGFTITPDHREVGAPPGAPLQGVIAQNHTKQLQSFLTPAQTAASPQILPPYLTVARGHDDEVHSIECCYKSGKLVEASAIFLRHQAFFNQQTPDSLAFFKCTVCSDFDRKIPIHPLLLPLSPMCCVILASHCPDSGILKQDHWGI